jgi:APA family basic amino acid/polyamine antiporter
MKIKNSKISLSISTLIVLVISNTIGSGIFLLPRLLAHYGSISIVAWIITSIGAIFIALTFSQLHIHKKQTLYEFCQNKLGNFIGFQVSFSYYNSLWIGNAGVVLVLLSYLKTPFSSVDISSIEQLFLGIIILWIITLINIKGFIWASILQKITFIFQLIPLFMIIFAGMPELNFNSLRNEFNISEKTNLMALFSSAVLSLWSFVGIEAAIMLAQKAKNLYNVKIATVMGTIIIAIIYITSISIIMGIIRPQELMYSEAPFYEVAIKIFGSLGGVIASICIVASCLGALNRAVILQSHIKYTSNNKNPFFMPFKRFKNKNLYLFSNILPNLLSSILLVILFLHSNHEQFSTIISLATLFVLLVYFLVIVSELKFLTDTKFIENKFSRLMIALIAFIYIFCMLLAIDKQLLCYGVITWCISSLFYFILQKNRFRKND